MVLLPGIKVPPLFRLPPMKIDTAPHLMVPGTPITKSLARLMLAFTSNSPVVMLRLLLTVIAAFKFATPAALLITML